MRPEAAWAYTTVLQVFIKDDGRGMLPGVSMIPAQQIPAVPLFAQIKQRQKTAVLFDLLSETKEPRLRWG
jgi:hypothetical protein